MPWFFQEQELGNLGSTASLPCLVQAPLSQHKTIKFLMGKSELDASYRWLKATLAREVTCWAYELIVVRKRKIKSSNMSSGKDFKPSRPPPFPKSWRVFMSPYRSAGSVRFLEAVIHPLVVFAASDDVNWI